jgi:hypothetical protein
MAAPPQRCVAANQVVRGMAASALPGITVALFCHDSSTCLLIVAIAHFACNSSFASSPPPSYQLCPFLTWLRRDRQTRPILFLREAATSVWFTWCLWRSNACGWQLHLLRHCRQGCTAPIQWSAFRQLCLQTASKGRGEWLECAMNLAS